MAPSLGVPVEHRDEGEFHAAFRSDLLATKVEAIVLSPFLHGGRASQYYALFSDRIRQGVRITIYTRSESEFAGDGREEHARVSASLRATGADLRTRKGMHEKAAALDGDILWHGSLNILSHGSSTESMLRIASPDLVRTVLTDLRLLEDKLPPTPDAAVTRVADAAPDCACPRCGSAMVVKHGAWTRVACPDPACGFEFDQRLSRWLLSAQARRRPA